MSEVNLYSKSHPSASRMIEVFEWIIAIDAYDFNDIEPLQELIKERREIPAELNHIIRSMLNGERVPNKKAAAKQKAPAANRLAAAGLASTLLGLLNDGIRMADPGSLPDDSMKLIERIAMDERKEVYEIYAEFRNHKSLVKTRIAEKIGVSVRTLDGYIRDLRSMIVAYPDI